MEHARNISDLLRDAESLEAAAAALARAFPELTIDGLIAVEKAEVMDLGWSPDAAHRDTTYLVSLAALLKPVARRHGDMPLDRAFLLLEESNRSLAGAIAAAMAATSARD